MKREKISKILEDPNKDPFLKERLLLVNKAREQALDLGLKVGNTFTQYSELDRNELIWVLSASKKDIIEPYTWWFPFVGRVPYKGFFNLDESKEYAKSLQKEGYDYYIRSSSAFSTLGWFNDPVLSTIVRGDELALVDTVIHESLHTTLWSKGNVSFNESFANFVGANGAILFYEKNDPEKLERAKTRWQDEILVSKTVANCVAGLSELRKKYSGKELIAKRDEFYNSEIQKLKAKLSKESHYQRLTTINNAQIVGLKIYTDRLELFDKLLAKYTLKEIVTLFKEKINSEDDPYKIIDTLL